MHEYFDQRETRSPDQRLQELTGEILTHIAHARDSAPAYTERLKEIDIDGLNTLEDIAALPLTRKSELMELQRNDSPFGGLAANKGESLLHVFASPGPIFEPQSARSNYWRMARALHAAGIRRGSLVHNGFSYHLTPAGLMMNDGCHALGAAVVPGGVGNTEQQLETVSLLKPDAYCGTPSFLRILLERPTRRDSISAVSTRRWWAVRPIFHHSGNSSSNGASSACSVTPRRMWA